MEEGVVVTVLHGVRSELRAIAPQSPKAGSRWARSARTLREDFGTRQESPEAWEGELPVKSDAATKVVNRSPYIEE